MKLQMTIAERVNNGCVLLDRVEPDWYERIDQRTLDIASPSRCVLAQLYGENGFLAGCFRLAQKVADYLDYFAGRHGFAMGYGQSIFGKEQYDREAELLTKEWVLQVGKRLWKDRQSKPLGQHYFDQVVGGL